MIYHVVNPDKESHKFAKSKNEKLIMSYLNFQLMLIQE